MPVFVITAHIKFGQKLKPIPPQTEIKTGILRMEIPASNEEEARQKARDFIASRTEVVVESCEKKAEEPSSRTIWEGKGDIGEILKNWPFGPK